MAAFDRSSDGRDPFVALMRLHHDVDERAAEIAKRHAGRLVCGNGCSACCLDGITVFEIEAEHIRRHHQGLLEVGHAHPRGACAFLDDRGSCRIYDHRPYVCRTQGLPLRWLDDDDAVQPLERRDICPLNEEGAEAIEKLPAEDCWTIGPFESQLLQIQVESGNDPLRRVSLRNLFRRGDEIAEVPRAARAQNPPGNRGKPRHGHVGLPGRPPRSVV